MKFQTRFEDAVQYPEDQREFASVSMPSAEGKKETPERVSPRPLNSLFGLISLDGEIYVVDSEAQGPRGGTA